MSEKVHLGDSLGLKRVVDEAAIEVRLKALAVPLRFIDFTGIQKLSSNNLKRIILYPHMVPVEPIVRVPPRFCSGDEVSARGSTRVGVSLMTLWFYVGPT